MKHTDTQASTHADAKSGAGMTGAGTHRHTHTHTLRMQASERPLYAPGLSLSSISCCDCSFAAGRCLVTLSLSLYLILTDSRSVRYEGQCRSGKDIACGSQDAGQETEAGV